MTLGADRRAPRRGTPASSPSSGASLVTLKGDEREFARVAAAGLSQSERRGDVMYPLGIDTARALLELGRGDAEAAWAGAGPASRTLHDRGWLEPSIFPVLPIAIEAALWTGRTPEADERLAWLDRSAESLPSRWAAAAAARARGLQAYLAGDTSDGRVLIDQSIADCTALGLPNERARAMLVRGQVLRRRGKRQEARADLEEAQGEFSRMGIHGFAALAGSEIKRMGGRQAAGDELTESERHVAELVSTGVSNQEAAAALFLSVKTVESHLSRVYRKLGVRSRAELASRWASERS